MEPIAWQVTMRLQDGRNLVQSVASRRCVARAVLDAGESRGLFVFSVPDTHLHLAAAATRQETGVLAHAVACSLRARLELPVPFEPARFTPIRDQRHLGSAVQYILGNASKHGNHTDPRCEGTSLPDLLGLRLKGRYTCLRLRRLLPRLTRADLLRHLPVDELHPGGTPRFLVASAAAAMALPDLQSRDWDSCQARTAAVLVAEWLGLTGLRTATLLGVSPRSIRRLRSQRADPLLVLAIQLQMGLMETTTPTAIHSRSGRAPCASSRSRR